jgi:hypothetical protein
MPCSHEARIFMASGDVQVSAAADVAVQASAAVQAGQANKHFQPMRKSGDCSAAKDGEQRSKRKQEAARGSKRHALTTDAPAARVAHKCYRLSRRGFERETLQHGNLRRRRVREPDALKLHRRTLVAVHVARVQALRSRPNQPHEWTTHWIRPWSAWHVAGMLK